MTTGPEPPPDRGDPEPRRWTTAELAASCGLDPGAVRSFWWALGLPDPGDQAVYTDEDREALAAVAASGLSPAVATRVVRAVGPSIARMAEWQVAAVVSASPDDPAASAAALARARPALEQIVSHAWRRHVEAGTARLLADAHAGSPSAAEASAGSTTDLTVGFADLVNFTSVSTSMDVRRIGDLVETFEARCADVVAERGGRPIKTIGDAILYVCDDADAAARAAFDVVEVVGRDPRLPDVRLGLASGPVVSRLGDVFGSPVNLAARLTALARRNRVLVDDATYARLPAGGYVVRRLSGRPLRGFGIVEPLALGRR